jgi:hypothetical protein
MYRHSTDMNLKYFRVQIKYEEGSVESVVESVLKQTGEVDEDRAKLNHTIEKNGGRGENSLWLERTGWKRTFAGKDMGGGTLQQEMVR